MAIYYAAIYATQPYIAPAQSTQSYALFPTSCSLENNSTASQSVIKLIVLTNEIHHLIQLRCCLPILIQQLALSMSSSKLSLPDHSMTDAEIRGLMKNYEIKNLTYSDLYNIYKKNALGPNFPLIIVPSITNLYYMYKPNGMFARIAPFAIPVVCAVQYFAALTYDIQNFCFKESDDSETVRRKILTLSNVQGWDLRFKKLGDEIEYYSKSMELQRQANQAQQTP